MSTFLYIFYIVKLFKVRKEQPRSQGLSSPPPRAREGGGRGRDLGMRLGKEDVPHSDMNSGRLWASQHNCPFLTCCRLNMLLLVFFSCFLFIAAP